MIEIMTRYLPHALAIVTWATRIDEAVSRRLARRRAAAAALAVLALSSGCATSRPAPAQITRLECGAPVCSIGQAGPSTVLWVQEAGQR